MNKIFLAIIGVVFVISAIVANSTLFTVHQASQALVLQFGKPVRVERDPGQNLKYLLFRMLNTLIGVFLI